MKFYYVHLIYRCRTSADKPFGEKEVDIRYYDSLPKAVQEMKDLSETTDVWKVELACVGEANIRNHELRCDSDPLLFCENYNVIPNTSGQSIYAYMGDKLYG